MAVIDPRSDKIVRRLSLQGCASPHSLLVDSARRLAFVACAANSRLLTIDLRTMKYVGNAGVGDSPDVLALDTSLHRLYVSSESGVVAVFAETTNGLRKLWQGFIAAAAHTVAVDSRTHLVYFPLQSGPTRRPQLLIMTPASPATPASGLPPTGGVTLPLAPGLQLLASPWQLLAAGNSPSPGAEARSRAGLLFPSALAFTVSVEPSSRAQLFWSVYCDGPGNDVIFNQQGSLPVDAPVTGQPIIPAGQDKCTLAVRLQPAPDSRARVKLFGH
jgi:hypothetical protein